MLTLSISCTTMIIGFILRFPMRNSPDSLGLYIAMTMVSRQTIDLLRPADKIRPLMAVYPFITMRIPRSRLYHPASHGHLAAQRRLPVPAFKNHCPIIRLE